MSQKHRGVNHSAGPVLQSSRVADGDKLKSTLNDCPMELLQAARIHGYRMIEMGPATLPIVAGAEQTDSEGTGFMVWSGTAALDPTTSVATGTGVCAVTSHATDNADAVYVSHPIFQLGSSQDAWFYLQMSIADVSANTIIVGMWDNDGTEFSPFVASTAATSALVDGIFFKFVAAASITTCTLEARQDAVVDTVTITLSTALADDTTGDGIQLAWRARGRDAVDYYVQVGTDAPTTGTLATPLVAAVAADYELMSVGIAHQNVGAGADSVHFTRGFAASG